jgi:hypothetical protein
VIAGFAEHKTRAGPPSYSRWEPCAETCRRGNGFGSRQSACRSGNLASLPKIPKLPLPTPPTFRCPSTTSGSSRKRQPDRPISGTERSGGLRLRLLSERRLQRRRRLLRLLQLLTDGRWFADYHEDLVRLSEVGPSLPNCMINGGYLVESFGRGNAVKVPLNQIGL